MAISSMMEMGNKMFIIPQDVETREDLLNVDRKTKEDIRLDHRLYVQNDWECNTIANTVVESLIKILYSHIKDNGVKVLENGDTEINFYDLILVAASNKKNEAAEKTGNINVKFLAGEKVDTIIACDITPENKEHEFVDIVAAYSYMADTDRTEAMKKIDTISRKLLADKYSIILPKDFQAVATAVVFLRNLYIQLIQKIVLTGKSSSMINFNDIIEFHALKKGDAVNVKLRPGMGAKLIIKSDQETEDEDDLLD